MILFFSKGPVDWSAAIASGQKIHTVRRGECPKVQPGAPLSFVADRFAPTRHTFFSGVCTGRQPVEISGGKVHVSGREISPSTFAANGGFDSDSQMFAYYGDNFSGTVIHFSNFTY